jgi:hypothetical protein
MWSDWTPIGDVDQDGFGDAWVNMPEGQLWFGGPDGLVATHFLASIPSVGPDVEPIPLGDFDGDSYDDILIPEVGIGFGNGRAPMAVVTIPDFPPIIPVGDVDGDGIADILALYPVPEVIFGGARQIAAQSRLSIGIEPPVATSSWSVSRDHGKAMIVFWNCAALGSRHRLTLQRWTVLGRVLTPLATIVDPRGIECETAYATSLGDVDGDEVTDFVTDLRDSGPNNLSLMKTILSTGLTSQAFKSRLLMLPSPLVFVRSVGDVNGDGLDDLLGMHLENTGSFDALYLYIGVKGSAPRRARTITADIWLRQ